MNKQNNNVLITGKTTKERRKETQSQTAEYTTIAAAMNKAENTATAERSISPNQHNSNTHPNTELIFI